MEIDLVFSVKLFLLVLFFSFSQICNANIIPGYKKINFNRYKKGVVPKIRVKVASDLPTVYISGTDLRRKNSLSGSLRKIRGRKRLKYSCNRSLRNSKTPKNIIVATLKSMTGLITLNGKDKYSGDLLLSVSSDGQNCDIINELSIERYISTLLSKEMNGSWHVEALKAQAIAARSYAIDKINTNDGSFSYDLESSEKHQVSGTFFDTTEKTLIATEDTFGLVLKTKKNNTLTPIFYHAKCGGVTLLPNQVWDGKVEGYARVSCPYDEHHGSKIWKNSLSKKRINKFLNWLSKNGHIGDIGSIKIKEDNFLIAPDKFKNLKVRLYIDDNIFIINKSLFRRYFGRKFVSSNTFIAKHKGGKIDLSGKGLGHGVGMCQLGALDLARRGWNFKKILSYYFPHHKLVKMY